MLRNILLFLCVWLSVVDLSLSVDTASLIEEYCVKKGSQFAPSPRSCQHYFVCSELPILHENVCKPENYFDAEAQSCYDNKPESCHFDDETNINCPPDGTHTFPHETSCGRYVKCVDGEKFEEVCLIGESFSPLRGYCMKEEEAECTVEPKLCPEVTEIGQFDFKASKLKCSKYYLCIKGHVETLECVPGQHYNQEKRWCESDKESECKEEPEGPIPPAIREIHCKNNNFMIVPHPESCEHYFICRNGQSELRYCPEQLVFDLVHAQCSIPGKNVLCILDLPTITTKG